MHESGLPSTLLFYQEAIDKESYEGTLFKGKRDAAHSVRIGSRTWANPRFDFLEGLTASCSTPECTWQVADNLWLNPSFKQAYLQKIADTPLRSKRYRYSCVGFIVLQQLVEARAGMPIDEFLQREFYGPMGLTHTGYNPLRFLKKEEIVPSSVDRFYGKTPCRVLCTMSRPLSREGCRAMPACSPMPPKWRRSTRCCSTAAN